MAIPGQAPTLTTASRAFAVFDPPTSLAGQWRTHQLGPRLFRWFAATAFAPTAMRGLEGKAFDGEGRGTTVCRRRKGSTAPLRMRATTGPAMADGRPATLLTYESGQSPLWNRVVEEVREVEPGLLLVVSRVNVPVLRRVGVPMLLENERRVRRGPASHPPASPTPAPVVRAGGRRVP